MWGRIPGSTNASIWLGSYLFRVVGQFEVLGPDHLEHPLQGTVRYLAQIGGGLYSAINLVTLGVHPRCAIFSEPKELQFFSAQLQV